MIAGTLCCIMSSMTTSICKEYYQYIFSQGILYGIGVGLLYVHFEITFNLRHITTTLCPLSL